MSKVKIGDKKGVMTIQKPTTPGNWLAKCECGEEREIAGSNFLRGKYETCSCASATRKTPSPALESKKIIARRRSNKPGTTYTEDASKALNMAARTAQTVIEVRNGCGCSDVHVQTPRITC